MSAITTDDKARLRHQRHRIGSAGVLAPIVNAVPLRPIALARINQASFAFPLTQITVDNTVEWSAIKTGMAFSIGTTQYGTDTTWGVVRKAPTSTILYIDAKGRGDSGYARDIAADLADNQYVTIYKHRPPWGLLSAIRGGIFYKQYDIAYSDQGSSPAPLAQFGTWRQAFVDEVTGTATLTFNSAPGNDPSGKSRDSFAWGAKTIIARQWSGDGGVAVGSETGSSVTYEFEPGFYVVELELEDSDGKLHSGFRYVWINTKTGVNAPLNTRFRCNISNDAQDAIGRSLNLTVFGDSDDSDLYPGQGVLITEPAYFGGEPLDVEDQRVHTYVGYAPEHTITRTRTLKSVEVKLESPMHYARRIPQVTQQMSEVATPLNWSQATSVLSNPVGAVWYQLAHHAPQLLQAHDFIFKAGLKSLRKQSFVWPQMGGIGQAFDMVAELMSGKIGNRSDGALVMALDGAFMEQADRDALVNKFDWQEGDIVGQLSHSKLFTPRIGQAKAYSFAYDGGSEPRAYGAVAPDDTQGQGTGRAEIAVIVPPSTAVAELLRTRQIAGHKYAFDNGLTGQFNFVADRNIDIAEPVDVDVWHGLNVADAYSPPSISRIIPVNVTRTWQRKGKQLSKTIKIDWRPETQGLPGRELAKERGGASKWIPGGINIKTPTLVTPPLTPIEGLYLNQGVGKIALPNTDGYMYLTRGWSAAFPLWGRYVIGGTGSLEDAIPYAFSTGYSNNAQIAATGTIDAIIVTTHEIGKLYDVFGPSPTYVVKKTFATPLAFPGNSGRQIQMERGSKLVAVASYYRPGEAQAGVWVVTSTDGGETWGNEVQVTAFQSTYFYYVTGLHVRGKAQNTVLVTAFTANGVLPARLGYRSTNANLATPTFSSISNPNLDGEGLASVLHAPWANNADESEIYMGYTDNPSGSTIINRFLRANGASQTDITPVDGSGRQYTPRFGQRSVSTRNDISNSVLVMGTHTPDGPPGTVTSTHAAPFLSRNKGVSYTQLMPEQALIDAYLGGAMVGNADQAYLWGFEKVAFFDGTAVVDKTSNIAEMSGVGRFLNILGAA